LKERRKKPIEIEPFSFYLSAWKKIAIPSPGEYQLDEKGRIASELVNARRQATSFSLIARKWTTSM